MLTNPKRDTESEKPTSPWILIPVGMFLILLGGIAFSVAFAIAAVIDGLLAVLRVLAIMFFLLIGFPAAVIAESHHR